MSGDRAELKPCERCGNVPETYQYSISEDGDWGYMDCGCGGGAVFLRGRDIDSCIPELFEAWNKRVEPPQRQADKERIVELESNVSALSQMMVAFLEGMISEMDVTRLPPDLIQQFHENIAIAKGAISPTKEEEDGQD